MNYLPDCWRNLIAVSESLSGIVRAAKRQNQNTGSHQVISHTSKKGEMSKLTVIVSTILEYRTGLPAFEKEWNDDVKVHLVALLTTLTQFPFFDMFINLVDQVTMWIRSSKSKKSTINGVAQWIEYGLRTKGSPVQFPVRAHAWVADQVPSGGHVRGNRTLMFLSSFSLPFPLSKNK